MLPDPILKYGNNVNIIYPSRIKTIKAALDLFLVRMLYFGLRRDVSPIIVCSNSEFVD